jgi:hypothetical protein
LARDWQFFIVPKPLFNCVSHWLRGQFRIALALIPTLMLRTLSAGHQSRKTKRIVPHIRKHRTVQQTVLIDQPNSRPISPCSKMPVASAKTMLQRI